ncbi:cytochrome c oxidase subunit 7C, mitochondrial-like [Oppia nitens]|uniref:cytochrome c oxidase subunit 7C, mitochondrial-like n=1 Tax=Oppia nitens TaxID=1686743 RepID=UPI0023DABB19|nr:cytochrome c oxidase subunit 7C, mitochondrial-like [Oppia nitens]
MLVSRLGLSATRRVLPLQRQWVRRSHDATYKGQNLPFDITSPRLTAIKFFVFFSIPFAVPFIIVRYQLKKAAGHYI